MRPISFGVFCLIILFAHISFTQTTQPQEITQTITAKHPVGSWKGWAKNDKSVPGWANTPPAPGTVTIVQTPPDEHRLFSGKVVGLDSFKDAQVAVVSLTYIYWIHKDAYHWKNVNEDGSFSITDDDKYPKENKSLVLSAPGHPWSFFPYIFKSPEAGRDILLQAEPGKPVRITVATTTRPTIDNFGVDLFALNPAWIHSNNPLGYQFADRIWTNEKSNGSLTVYLPLHPIALYLGGEGTARDWEIVDARQADHFHFVLLPGARLQFTVIDENGPVKNAHVLMGNDAAALSLRAGNTDENGHFESGGLAPGKWWVEAAGENFEVNVKEGETVKANLDLTTGEVEK